MVFLASVPSSVRIIGGILLVLVGIALFIFITVESYKECKKEVKEKDTCMKKFWTIVGDLVFYFFECLDGGYIFFSFLLVIMGLTFILGL